METSKLQTLHQPSLVKVLHESLLGSLNHPPHGARRMEDRSDLPIALQRLAVAASRDGGSWAAWRINGRVHFCTAEIALDHSREHGQVVLSVSTSDEDGRIQRCELWAQTANGAWRSKSV